MSGFDSSKIDEIKQFVKSRQEYGINKSYNRLKRSQRLDVEWTLMCGTVTGMEVTDTKNQIEPILVNG